MRFLSISQGKQTQFSPIAMVLFRTTDKWHLKITVHTSELLEINEWMQRQKKWAQEKEREKMELTYNSFITKCYWRWFENWNLFSSQFFFVIVREKSFGLYFFSDFDIEPFWISIVFCLVYGGFCLNSFNIFSSSIFEVNN